MAHSPLPSINNKSSVRSVSRSASPSNTEYLAFSYSNLDPPFGLDFTKERTDICLSPTFDVDSDEELSPSLCSINSLQSRATTGLVFSNYRRNIYLCSRRLISSPIDFDLADRKKLV